MGSSGHRKNTIQRPPSTWDISKNRGKMTPQIIPFVHRVWNHYFHHPSWGPTFIVGNTHMDDTVDGSEIPFPTTWDGAKTL